MKKVLLLGIVPAILILCIFVVSVVLSSTQPREYKPYQGTPPSAAFLENQAAALDLHAQLLQAFSDNTPRSETDSGAIYSGLTAGQYPEEYAGAYLNADGNLVLLVTGNIEKSADCIETFLLPHSTDVIYRTARHSYRELLRVMDAARPFLAKTELGFELLSTSVDDYNNCVIATFRELNEETKRLFKQTVSDSDAVVFRQSAGTATME